MPQSDFLFLPTAARSGVWVQLVSNTTSTPYVSTAATDANGMFTHSAPTDALGYTVNIGPSGTGPWTFSGDANYFLPGGTGGTSISVTVFLETSTDLGIGATRAGATHDTGASLSAYTRFRAFASSIVASAANGLAIQQSDDNSTWFITNSITVGAGTANGTIIEALITKRYCRVFYTNGATGMTTSVFNLSTALVT